MESRYYTANIDCFIMNDFIGITDAAQKSVTDLDLTVDDLQQAINYAKSAMVRLRG